MVRTKKQIDRSRTKKKRSGEEAASLEAAAAAAAAHSSSSEDDQVEKDISELNPRPASKKKEGRKKKSGYLSAQRNTKPASKQKSAKKKGKPEPKEEPLVDEDEEFSESSSDHKEPSSEESYQEEESESEEEESNAMKKPPPNAKRSNRGRQARKPSCYEEDSEEEVKQVSKRGRPTRRVTAGKRQTQSSSSEEEEFDDKFETPEKRTRGSLQLADSGNSHNDDDTPASSSGKRRSTPSRASATMANARLARLDYGGDEANIMKKPKRKSQKKGDDDEEYVADDHEEESESEGDSELGDDDDESEEHSSKLQSQAHNVDNDDIFDAESSGDEGVGPSPTLEIRSAPRSADGGGGSGTAGREMLLDEEAEESEEEASLSGVVGGSEPKLSQSSVPSMPDCPSTEDAVTMEKLPERHICAFAPNQRDRQCFCLHTLHRIAMSSSIRDDNGKQTFLQPPHFRTPMSDDLIDQIACRFGRSALDLLGEYYRRNKGSKVRIADSEEKEEELDDSTFLQRVNRFVRSCMGSQDIYCCPICYVEAHHRLASMTTDGEYDVEDDDSENSNDEDEKHHEVSLWHDPMTVLGELDNNSFKLAASFCFRKGVEVKRHLVHDHNIDPSNLDGNGLFQRFKIRDGDGLLQRFVEKTFKGKTYQGDMQRYWNAGNSSSFVFLLNVMHRHASIKSKLEESSQDDEVPDSDKERISDAQEFFDSFVNRARKTWKSLSAPFLKITKEDLKDFVVEGDVEEDEQPHFAFAFQQEQASEEQLVEELRKKRRQRGEETDSEDDDDEEDEEDGSDSESSDNEPPPGYYSEEEEEDEWMKARRPSLRGNKRRPSSEDGTPKTAKRLRKGGSGTKGNPVTIETPKKSSSVASKPNSSVRRLVIEDGSSESD